MHGITCYCPLGLVPHFYWMPDLCKEARKSVSMPSRAYASFLHCSTDCHGEVFQIVSMPSRAYTSFLRDKADLETREKIFGVSMPSRASTSLLQEYMTQQGWVYSCVSMPSRASTSLLPKIDWLSM